ncbi:hypothetical protein C5E45_16315 [Nocardia nova]|uniref:Uncharacterized protein n=1 Tax=Nocardia nova TaxID=37330 RepID=A0A2S6APU7_9NOCA|nr:hypothetical protein [Nocardia nova]PPJ27836.1 hypothetical protein C5E41_14530 [Nocardia nova]PPJ37213.1 hypothetical protein C5E45_16315 [Nocardia nova]
MTAEVDPRLDELTQQLSALRTHLGQIRRKRMDVEKTTPSPAPLVAAAQQAYRDRDAVVSPTLEELRGRADALATELAKSWASADNIRWILFRLRETGVAQTLSAAVRSNLALVQEELDREAALRAEISEDLSRRDVVGFTVPAPLHVHKSVGGE